jgi:hypothetical protein
MTRMTQAERAEFFAQDEADAREFAPHWKARGFTVHIGKMVDPEGRTSPLCAGDEPRALLASNRESWVFAPAAYEHVNCDSCMAAKGNTNA